MQQEFATNAPLIEGGLDPLAGLDERDRPPRPPWWRIRNRVWVIEAATARLMAWSAPGTEPHLA